MKKYIINIILLLGIGFVTLCFIMGNMNMEQLFFGVKNLSPYWLVAGIVCIIGYWIVETIIQYVLVGRMHKGNGIWNAFKVVMTGHFFNAVTPFASGGQPMQVILMLKQGVPFGTSASILLSKFIIYQFVLTLYSTLVLILKFDFFHGRMKSIIYLALIGFIVNLGVVIVLIMSVFLKKQLKKICFFIINILYKFHIIKNKYTYKRKVISQVELFSENITIIKKNKGLLANVSILTILQLTLYFCIPYAVYRAFGFEGTSLFLIISAAALIVMLTSFIPIPGGSGVAEGSFFLLFQVFFPKSVLPTAILCWRMITFYMPLFFGAVVSILPNERA